MALTITTVENVTTIAGTGGGATDVLIPSGAEIGRYRIRVIRWVNNVGAAGNTAVITGITPKPDGTGNETQTIWSSNASGANFIDSTSFPDECEFRGRIQANVTSTGTSTIFLYHG